MTNCTIFVISGHSRSTSRFNFLYILWNKKLFHFQFCEKCKPFFPRSDNSHCYMILEHIFHISSIEPKDFWGLPQILPEYAKFLHRACLQHSLNIPSLHVTRQLKQCHLSRQHLLYFQTKNILFSLVSILNASTKIDKILAAYFF